MWIGFGLAYDRGGQSIGELPFGRSFCPIQVQLESSRLQYLEIVLKWL